VACDDVRDLLGRETGTGPLSLRGDRRRLFRLDVGGSRLQIAGPTGAFIVILAGITANYGIDGPQIATLISGPSSS
ncbi:MAG TPA: hypothetical protein VNR70_01060, partial [Steroidobacteraceae bacterium]|nr:hypothetical protein [Steroidobacteraceae bacterium]